LGFGIAPGVGVLELHLRLLVVGLLLYREMLRMVEWLSTWGITWDKPKISQFGLSLWS